MQLRPGFAFSAVVLRVRTLDGLAKTDSRAPTSENGALRAAPSRELASCKTLASKAAGAPVF